MSFIPKKNKKKESDLWRPGERIVYQKPKRAVKGKELYSNVDQPEVAESTSATKEPVILGEKQNHSESGKTAVFKGERNKKLEASYSLKEFKEDLENIVKLEIKACKKLFKVLVVDDNAEILNLNASFVRSECKHKVFTAKNGLEALEILKREDIDLILSDYRMPEMCGFKLHQEIQKLPEHQRAEFVLITGMDTDQEVENLKRAGVKVIAKPFSFSKVKALVLRVYMMKLRSIINE